MKKVILSIVMVATTLAGISAQNVFFHVKEGKSLVYASLNGSGKVQSYTRQTVSKVEGDASNMSVSYVVQPLDKKQKPVDNTTVDYSVNISNGVIEYDMKNFAGFETAGVLEVSGDKLRLPSTLSPGDKLDDVNFTFMFNLGIKIVTAMSFTEQECLAVEDVTVPAGTFKCVKLTQTSSATALRKTVTTKILSWYALGIGTVKTETYSDKGKLQSSVVLQSLEE